MDVRKTNIFTDECTDTHLTKKEISEQLSSRATELCDFLISQGIAQHRDEARVLLIDALDNYAVKLEVARLAKQRIENGVIGFGYSDSDRYRNVNFDQEPKIGNESRNHA